MTTIGIMTPILFVSISALISLAIGVFIVKRRFDNFRDNIEKEITSAEQEFFNDLDQINLNDLPKTKAGKKLINLIILNFDVLPNAKLAKYEALKLQMDSSPLVKVTKLKELWLAELMRPNAILTLDLLEIASNNIDELTEDEAMDLLKAFYSSFKNTLAMLEHAFK